MLSTKKALPSLTKSIIFAMAATVSMSASAGDIAVEATEVLTNEATEIVTSEGDIVTSEPVIINSEGEIITSDSTIVNAEGEIVELTEEELAEKAAMEQEASEIIPAE